MDAVPGYPLSPSVLTWLRVKTTLDSQAFPFTYNKLSPPPYLGAGMSLPFLFISVFHSINTYQIDKQKEKHKLNCTITATIWAS